MPGPIIRALPAPGLPPDPPVLPAAAIGFAALGFATTMASIGLALIPAEDEPNKVLAVTKVLGLTALLVMGGAIVYWFGRRRRT